ncbi:MAG: hypothetical protein E3K36_11385 [Candidatus Brocadia sp.]|nr:hypothetical protein [Candidatus Brocadia sp.]
MGRRFFCISLILLLVGIVRGTFAHETSVFMVPATPTLAPTPQPPKVTTGESSLSEGNSVILEGIVNAHGLLTTAWFDYGTSSGSYNNKSSTQIVTGTTDTKVSINIGKLLEETIYYYRIAAQDSAGTSYGDEKYFGLIPLTPTVTPTPGCKAEEITASPHVLRLKKEKSDDVTVTVTCSDSTPVVGETVTAKVKSGKKRVSVTPPSQDTDTNGKAIFTITATQKTGKAKVEFKSAGLKTTVAIKVKNK